MSTNLGAIQFAVPIGIIFDKFIDKSDAEWKDIAKKYLVYCFVVGAILGTADHFFAPSNWGHYFLVLLVMFVLSVSRHHIFAIEQSIKSRKDGSLVLSVSEDWHVTAPF